MAFKRAGVSRREEGRGCVFRLDGEGMQLTKGAGNEGSVLFMKKNECDHSHCPCEASSAGRSRYLGSGHHPPPEHGQCPDWLRKSSAFVGNLPGSYASRPFSGHLPLPPFHMPPRNVLHVMESFQLRFDDQQGCEQGCIEMFALPVHWAGNSEAVCVNCL
jgi:hypothetical protein